MSTLPTRFIHGHPIATTSHTRALAGILGAGK